MLSQMKDVEHLTQKQCQDENEGEIFSMKEKEKKFLMQVKTNCTNLEMQMDTASKIMLIPRNSGE